jgi:hypothetical protein
MACHRTYFVRGYEELCVVTTQWESVGGGNSYGNAA